MIEAKNSFTNELINWYSIVKRDLPWRDTNDPYKIWLSEIILQQTRIEQGLPYYNRFVESFPTVENLATANTDKVLKLWEGLGYYSRARNLHKAAKVVVDDYRGSFPDSYDQLISLPGVGPYTAAAIASIAFGKPTPVIDGNVYRFVARYFGVEKDIADAKNRKYFLEILQEVISHEYPGTFNQAMMEFGATVCKPSSPDCGNCGFRQSCYAYEHKKQGTLPIKTKKIKTKEVYIAYLVFEHNKQTLMRQRIDSIWTGLYEFPHKTTQTPPTEAEVLATIKDYPNVKMTGKSGPIKHLLSHRKLWVSFYHIDVSTNMTFARLAKDFGLNPYTWEEVLTLPRPKVIVNHLQQAVF